MWLDILYLCDIVEDVVIVYGYNNIVCMVLNMYMIVF